MFSTSKSDFMVSLESLPETPSFGFLHSSSCLQNKCQLSSHQICIPGRRKEQETKEYCLYQENRTFLENLIFCIIGQNCITQPLLPRREAPFSPLTKDELQILCSHLFYFERLQYQWQLTGQKLLIRIMLEVGPQLLRIEEQILAMKLFSNLYTFFFNQALGIDLLLPFLFSLLISDPVSTSLAHCRKEYLSAFFLLSRKCLLSSSYFLL